MPDLLPTFSKAAAQLHIDVNGFYVPFKSIIASVQRFCTPAYFHHDDPVVDLTRSGSAMRLRYRGRNLALLTRHQMDAGYGALTAENFTITVEEPSGRSYGMTPNMVTRIRMDREEHENLGDILLLEYEDVRNGRDISGLFLRTSLNDTLRNVPTDKVKVTFAVGYPDFAGVLN